MKIPKTLIFAIFIIIVFLRCVLDHSDDLMLIVTSFNVVAALIVLLEIAAGAKSAILQKIESTCAATTIAVREKKKFKRVFAWALTIGVVLFVGLTLLFCRSSLANDIISMASLGLSLLNDEIILGCKNLYKV